MLHHTPTASRPHFLSTLHNLSLILKEKKEKARNICQVASHSWVLTGFRALAKTQPFPFCHLMTQTWHYSHICNTTGAWICVMHELVCTATHLGLLRPLESATLHASLWKRADNVHNTDDIYLDMLQSQLYIFFFNDAKKFKGPKEEWIQTNKCTFEACFFFLLSDRSRTGAASIHLPGLGHQ